MFQTAYQTEVHQAVSIIEPPPFQVQVGSGFVCNGCLSKYLVSARPRRTCQVRCDTTNAQGNRLTKDGEKTPVRNKAGG
jgi:hypothetical protein